MTDNSAPLQGPSRPLGVWFLTIYAFLYAGIFPFLSSINSITTGHFAENSLFILITVPVCFAAASSAIGAWEGREWGRKGLLLFASIYYITLGISMVVLLNTTELPDAERAVVLGRAIRGIVFPAIYIIYFNKNSARMYYAESEAFRKGKTAGLAGLSKIPISDVRSDSDDSSYEIIGFYPIHPTVESINQAAAYYGYQSDNKEDGQAIEPLTSENYNNLFLIEIKVEGEYSADLLSKITQRLPGQPPEDGQAPYLEFYLDESGHHPIQYQTAVNVPARRICFFFHFIDPAIPLSIGDRNLPVPAPTPLPQRLTALAHYYPVD